MSGLEQRYRRVLPLRAAAAIALAGTLVLPVSGSRAGASPGREACQSGCPRRS